MKNLLIKLFVVAMTMLNIAPFTFKAVHAEKAKVRTHHIQQLIDIQSTVLPIKKKKKKLEKRNCRGRKKRKKDLNRKNFKNKKRKRKDRE